MKSLKQLCSDLIYKECSFETNYKLKWLNCGMRCMPFKLYQMINVNEYWYCTCKRRKFKITKPNNPKFLFYITVRANNCFHCWFLFTLEIKIKLIHKYRNNLVQLASLLIKFFEFINKYKYIYQCPNYQNMELDYYNQFEEYLDEKLGCLCFENRNCRNFL